MKTLLSIIVPIYNGEPYLSMLFSSLKRQDIFEESNASNVEVILVNDGSTDNSLYVMKDFALTKTNVRIVDKVNGGLSSARNAGIKAAEGEYIYMPDCDDVLAPHSLVVLTNILKKSGLPILRFQYKNIAINEEESFMENHNFQDYRTKIVSRDDYILETNGLRGDITACTSIINRDFFISNNLFFNEEITLCEDVPFNWQLFTTVDRLVKCDNVIYGYVIRPSSLLHNSDASHLKRKLSSYYPFIKELKRLVPQNGSSVDALIRDSIEETIQVMSLRTEMGILSRGFLSPDEIDRHVDRLVKDKILPLSIRFPFKIKDVRPHATLYYLLWIAQHKPAFLKLVLKTAHKFRHT